MELIREQFPPTNKSQRDDVLRRDKMKSLILFIAVIALLVGCTLPQANQVANVVQEEQLSAFLEQVKTQDYHDVARTGRELMKPGLLIPDYKTKLNAFPSRIPEEGQVLYELMTFQNVGKVGGINLFLNEETGEIIRFIPFEVTIL